MLTVTGADVEVANVRCFWKVVVGLVLAFAVLTVLFVDDVFGSTHGSGDLGCSPYSHFRPTFEPSFGRANATLASKG